MSEFEFFQKKVDERFIDYLAKNYKRQPTKLEMFIQSLEFNTSLCESSIESDGSIDEDLIIDFISSGLRGVLMCTGAWDFKAIVSIGVLKIVFFDMVGDRLNIIHDLKTIGLVQIISDFRFHLNIKILFERRQDILNISKIIDLMRKLDSSNIENEKILLLELHKIFKIKESISFEDSPTELPFKFYPFD